MRDPGEAANRLPAVLQIALHADRHRSAGKLRGLLDGEIVGAHPAPDLGASVALAVPDVQRYVQPVVHPHAQLEGEIERPEVLALESQLGGGELEDLAAGPRRGHPDAHPQGHARLGEEKIGALCGRRGGDQQDQGDQQLPDHERLRIFRGTERAARLAEPRRRNRRAMCELPVALGVTPLPRVGSRPGRDRAVLPG